MFSLKQKLNVFCFNFQMEDFLAWKRYGKGQLAELLDVTHSDVPSKLQSFDACFKVLVNSCTVHHLTPPVHHLYTTSQKNMIL